MHTSYHSFQKIQKFSVSSKLTIHEICKHQNQDTYIKTLECEPMPNVMAALPNIGSVLCSSAQHRKVWLTPLLECRAVTLPI